MKLRQSVIIQISGKTIKLVNKLETSQNLMKRKGSLCSTPPCFIQLYLCGNLSK